MLLIKVSDFREYKSLVSGAFSGEVSWYVIAAGFTFGVPFALAFLATAFDDLAAAFEQSETILKISLVLGSHCAVLVFL